MTNQEKDLKNARYENYPKDMLIAMDYVNQYFTDEELDRMGEMVLSEFGMKYVQWLEQKGVIKFTENRS